jgi:hypothetical protein
VIYMLHIASFYISYFKPTNAQFPVTVSAKGLEDGDVAKLGSYITVVIIISIVIVITTTTIIFIIIIIT